MKSFKHILLVSFFAALAMTSCITVVEVETVTVSQSSALLLVGDHVQLYASVLPSNAVKKDITWASSNHHVATVNESGMVEAVARGMCEITAMAGGVIGKCSVTVKDVTAQSITLSAESLQLGVGRSETLTATVIPDNAVDKTITWSSENDGIATVDESGKVTAVGQGETNIIAQCGIATAKCKVSVSIIPVKSFRLDKLTMDLFIGETATLEAIVTPKDASYSGVFWQIEQLMDIISLTPGDDGTALITALYPGVAGVQGYIINSTGGWETTEWCMIKVTGIDAESIALSDDQLEMGVGDSKQLTATVSPDNVTDKTIQWSSSSTDVATVSSSGLVRAVGLGTTTIYATCSGKTARCSVTVSDTEGLCFEAVETGNIDVTNSQNRALKYSFDGIKWKSETRSSFSVRLEKGQKLYFSGNTSRYLGYLRFFCSAKCYVSGNIMSLISPNYKDITSIGESALLDLFSGNYNIDIHPEKDLLLPATQLGSLCYEGMFRNCISMTQAPVLPATTIPERAYQYMFEGCSGLKNAPELPATTVGQHSYYGMFKGCTGLTQAPTLPAITISSYCYAYMFEGCTNLIDVPGELPATALKEQCYYGMFKNCTSLASAPKLPAVNLATRCYYVMFEGCSSLTKAPDLPALKINDYSRCYSGMFYNCSRLNYIKAMFTDSPNQTNNWVYGVASSGTFVKNSAATWTETGPHGIPSGWTVVTADK